jgi:membrane protein
MALAPLVALFLTIFDTRPLRRIVNEARKFLLENLAPQSIEPVDTFIDQLINNLNTPSTFLSVFGYGGLIVTSIALFITVQEVSNSIWGAQNSKSLHKTVINFWSALTFAPILIILSIGTKLYLENTRIVKQLSSIEFLRKIASMGLPFIFSFAGFFLLFYLIPNTYVAYKSALFGAFASSFMWEVSKTGFGIYVNHAVSLKNLYGSVGAIPIFLLWLYITWVIAISGMCFTYCHQNFRWRNWLLKRKITVDPDIHYSLKLRVMVAISRNFTQGSRPLSAQELSEILDFPPVVIQDTLFTLYDQGLLSHIADGTGVFQPSRDIEKITLAQIVPLLQSDNSDILHFLKSRFPGRFTKLGEDLVHAGENLTLKEIILSFNDQNLNMPIPFMLSNLNKKSVPDETFPNEPELDEQEHEELEPDEQEPDEPGPDELVPDEPEPDPKRV